jgi:hypothetical protein
MRQCTGIGGFFTFSHPMGWAGVQNGRPERRPDHMASKERNVAALPDMKGLQGGYCLC